MQDIAIVQAQLDRVLNFFPRVDTKVAGLFTVNSAILTISALNVQAGDLKHWYIAIPGILLLLGLIGSYTFLYRCNFPRLDGGHGSLIFFRTIQERTEPVYRSEYEAATEDAYRADLLGQIWQNANILCDKYRAIAMAVRITLATLLPFACFLMMSAIEHSRIPVLH